MNKETEKVLIDILAQAEHMESAREVRHEIKAYILREVIQSGSQKKCLACGSTWTAPVWFCPQDDCKNAAPKS